MKTLKRWMPWLALACCSALAAQAYAQTAQAGRPPATAKATFAGGCFWCMEPPYDKLPGRDLDDLRATWAARRRIRPTSRSRPARPGTPKSCRSNTTRRK